MARGHRIGGRTVKGETHNNTPFTIEQVNRLPLLATVKSNWRGRNVRLLEHPGDDRMVVSDGITFDLRKRVICEEPREAWADALVNGVTETF
jgi:hypothetical protein